jgi:Mg-chelatase subunit ChlD
MHGDKMGLLKDAIDNFVNRCDFQNTSIAVETFPASLELSLTSVSFMITSSVASLNAQGDTPMRRCVESCLEKIPMTRGIIVSDGEATDWRLHEDDEEGAWPQDELLTKYKKAQIPIDCVHIGDSSSGEELLRRVARETGGVYLKFTDVSAFSKGFSYLTPGYRAQLTDGSVSAEQLGANEVRR